MHLKYPLILASASPRRQEILAGMGVEPTHIIPADIDETERKGELPRPYVKRMAQEKARKTASDYPDHAILGADTVVVMGRRILQKAADRDEEIRFLKMLSGRRHKVMGGICLLIPNQKPITRVCETIVKFKRLSDREIAHYADSKEWEGKAGGYGIQGTAASFIPFISGSYSNILGLSIYDTRAMLQNLVQ